MDRRCCRTLQAGRVLLIQNLRLHKQRLRNARAVVKNKRKRACDATHLTTTPRDPVACRATAGLLRPHTIHPTPIASHQPPATRRTASCVRVAMLVSLARPGRRAHHDRRAHREHPAPTTIKARLAPAAVHLAIARPAPAVVAVPPAQVTDSTWCPRQGSRPT